MSDELEGEPLVFRMAGPSGTTPVALVHLDVVDNTQIVRAVIRPDLPQSEIALQWASALDLSPGAGMVVQLAAGEAEDALWGPAQLITPSVVPALDDEIDDKGLGGFLLGADFLQNVLVGIFGPVRLVLFLAPPTETDEEA